MSENTTNTMSTATLDRSKPPKPGPIAAVSFPPIVERVLSNGLKVYIVENHEQPIVTTSLYIRGGSILDPKNLQGLAVMTSDLITKGTATRTALQIADEIDFVGGSLSSSASWDAITLSTTTLTRFLPTGLELLADVLLHPTFPEEELERMRLQRIASIKQAKADAGYLADTVFTKVVFPDHTYGQQAGGTEQSIQAMTRDSIVEFYQKYLGPNNAFLVAAGDINVESYMATLEGLLSTWKVEAPVTKRQTPQALQSSVRVAVVEKPAAVQSALRIGHMGIERNTPDFIPLYVLNMLLGGYFNSRINLNLREKHGFTYGARSFFDVRVEPGPFAVATEVSTQVTVRAIEETLNELAAITKEAVTDAELEMVKNYVIGSFPLQIETPQQVASRIAMIILYGLEHNYYDTYRQKVAALTKEELLNAAQKYLHPDRLSIVVAGDLGALREPMSTFGKVEVFSPDGELLETVA